MPQKPSIRVRVSDGKPREWKKLKAALGTFVDVRQDGPATCFRLATHTERQLTDLRPKLAALGLEELAQEEQSTPSSSAPLSIASPTGSKKKALDSDSTEQVSPKKPYSFVSHPETCQTKEPIWHNGSGSTDRVSGEIRFELQNLTPLLVGWERQSLRGLAVQLPAHPGIRCTVLPWTAELEKFAEEGARQTYPDPPDPVPFDPERLERLRQRVHESRKKYVKELRENQLDLSDKKLDQDEPASKLVQAFIWDHDCGRLKDRKSVLCPLRAPWDPHRPVLIPGDSLKGLLRHELGALLGAPMERVAERSYSYRPNLQFPLDSAGRKLEPRLARVLSTSSVTVNATQYRVPDRVAIFSLAMRYDQKYYPGPLGPIPPSTAHAYKGGMGAGLKLPPECLSGDAKKKTIHTHVDLLPRVRIVNPMVTMSTVTTAQYARTLEHYFDNANGHFSSRHPHLGNKQKPSDAAVRSLKNAAARAFQIDDLIWVEWDTSKKQIVSFGWHYYYRWAYQDSVRRIGGAAERKGLFPLREEKGDKPEKLSAVRRLFGYAADDNNDGVKGIGKGNHSQLMGRISVNAAIEVIEPGKEDEDARFERPLFLKELGQPKPSAVENYLKQPYHPNRNRPGDTATLLTYGDAAGYDSPGQLAGRKFYLDRADAYEPYSTPNKIAPWKDATESNRLNDRSTLAIDVSKPKHRFRFTLRFRDLDPDELAAVLLALCPDQFAKTVGGTHKDGYCSKLGYGRPLGLGTVRIEAKELHFLEHDANGNSTLKPESVSAWFGNHVKLQSFPVLTEWLNVHQHKHQQGQDYERDPDDNEIFTVHTKLRAKHSKQRRYK